MKIIGKIRKFLVTMFYSLPFGMKAGEVLSSSNASKNSFDVSDTLNRETLSDGLIKGVVNKEVEALRYRDYRVSEESRKYKYISGDRAVKVREFEYSFDGKIKFTQKNKRIENDILSELNRVDTKENSVDTYVLNFDYGENFRRFKLEKYCDYYQLDIRDKNVLTLFFNSYPNINEVTSKMFLNEFNKVYNDLRCKSELKDEIKNVWFVTNNVENEKNYVKYTLNDLSLLTFGKKDDMFFIEYDFKTYTREDLTSKFFVDDLDEKYKNHEAKEIVDTVIEIK